MRNINLRRLIIVAYSFIFITSVIPFFAYSQEDSAGSPTLIVFYSPNCHKCIWAKSKLLPDIEKEFKGQIDIEYRDITDIENYKLLLSLQEKFNVKIKNIFPVFFLEGNFLTGRARLDRELKNFVVKSLKKPGGRKEYLPQVDLIAHFKTFQPLAITSAGLIDGINPCAFTVIVFFISFLALQGYRKRELIIIGLSFIFAVFLTYLFIGLGIFSFLYRLKGFWLPIKIFNFSVGIASVILGILCIYDFFKFRKTKETEGLILQLPKGIKQQIHKIIGMHYRVTGSRRSEPQGVRRRIFKLSLSALITGFLVSILEAVCTGQVYLPTIAFVLKTTPLKLEALLYLLLYNFMFIVPLLIIFFFALLGVSSERFSKVLRRHLGKVKILMAFLFFGLGIFLLWKA